jgi:D-alanyl-D-alanine carboxypeptidase/D-alanyl-D-alanine-endopeptidase (penicillin-binding protein 4)
MTFRLTRRALLAGLMAGGASAATANAPVSSPRPMPRGGSGGASAPSALDLVEQSGLSGRVTFAVADAGTGQILETLGGSVPMPPASVTKAPTALYALDTLGPSHRFSTRLLATGPIASGRLDGDLILAGSGDPTLDTDGLGQLAADLKAAGVTEVAGDFRIDASALPSLPWIDPDQPAHVGYNPPVGAVNLNYNRVHFEWKRAAGDWNLSMEARALRYSPAVQVARVDLADRALPVFTYEDRDGIDRWTVARGALGNGGSRWLPVRRPSDYAGEVFRTLARSHGIVLRPGPPAPGATGTVIAEWQSQPLPTVLADMLEYSTNLTAEVCGLTASAARGPMPDSLAASGARMDGWLRDGFGLRTPGFVDHSGLGYGNTITAADMAAFLARTDRLEPLLETHVISDSGRTVRAKTGTLNFVSALAGYLPAGNRRLAFAIFTADTARRDAIPPDERERPPGARTWAGRARELQRDLLTAWSVTLAA